MRSFNVLKIFNVLLCLLLLIVLSVPAQCEARRVIFYGKPSIYTGQLFATSPKKEPCPKCQMRDHRGRCRRAYNPDQKC